MTRNDLADAIAQTGRDEMAQALVDYLADLDADDYSDDYLDGLQDAITTLVQAGATDPRPCECMRNPLGHTRAQHPS